MTIGAYEQHIYQLTLAILGGYDLVPKSETLAQRVSNLEEADFQCGHWIQQEKPAQTNAVMLDWLARHYAWGLSNIKQARSYITSGVTIW